MNNIIFVNRYFHPDYSATSQMLSDLAFALARDGYSIRVVTSRQTYENPDSNLPARECYGGVEIHRVWSTCYGRPNLAGRALDYTSFNLAALWQLLRIAQSGDVVVAKTDPPLISIVAWIASKIKGARLVNWLQDVFPEVAVALGVMTWQPLIGLTKWLRNKSLHGASMNIVLSEGMRERIIVQGIEPASIDVIHNWADGDRIKPVSAAKNPLRQIWNLQDKFVVGYSGNMGRAHEFDTIVGAMKRLNHEDHIAFLFIGGGAGRKKLENAVREFGLRNCHFRPYQSRERLSDSLSVADVHLVSLRPELEGLIVPSKIYGIAAVGRPLIFIGDSNGEIGQLVSKLGFGVAVQSHDSDMLARHILELEKNPSMSVAMGEQSRRSYEQFFNKQRSIAAWCMVLSRLVVSKSKL